MKKKINRDDIVRAVVSTNFDYMSSHLNEIMNSVLENRKGINPVSFNTDKIRDLFGIDRDFLDETDLQNALKLDFEQLKTDANTPDRGYSVPIDNVKKLIDTYHK